MKLMGTNNKKLSDKIVDGSEIVKANKPETSSELSDTKRMIELLEAIDWKLWMIYKKYEGTEEE